MPTRDSSYPRLEDVGGEGEGTGGDGTNGARGNVERDGAAVGLGGVGSVGGGRVRGDGGVSGSGSVGDVGALGVEAGGKVGVGDKRAKVVNEAETVLALALSFSLALPHPTPLAQWTIARSGCGRGGVACALTKQRLTP